MMMPQSIGPMNGLTICTQANTRKASSVSRITRSMNRSLEKKLPASSMHCSPCPPLGRIAGAIADAGKPARRLRLSCRKMVRPSTTVRAIRPSTRRPSNAVFFDRLLRLASVTFQGASGIEQDEIGRGALCQPAGVEAQDRAGASVMRAQQRQQAELALVHQPQADRQHGLHADHAAGGLGERQPLAVLVLRAMVAGDDIDRPVRSASTTARRSSSARRGGETLAKVR